MTTPGTSDPSAAHRFDVLVHAIQELSLVERLEDVQEVVRHAAREIAGADGATFVLRDGDCCFYADEDAIAPLWKGSRFPLEACISGWSMLNRKPVAIQDIYADERIPHDAYRPTFVRSLAMVPIRDIDPLGAIGVYWAGHHAATSVELGLLQALANSTAVAFEIVQRREREEAERVLSRTDALTGLPNRRGWDEAIAAALVPGAVIAVAVVDVDGLKLINDSDGHGAGDAVLKAAAAEWGRCVRPQDFLARIGGDEFAVLLPGCDAARAQAIAARLADARPAGTSCSVGAASWDGAESAEELLTRADEALYAAKRGGRAQAVLAS